MDRTAENAVDSDEEDEDFVPERDDAGSPTGDTEEEGSDAGSPTGDTDQEGSDADVEVEAAAPKPTAAKREGGEQDGSRKKKKRKRQKDPNAPKRALSSFMYFSQAEREELKKKNPGLPFTEVGRVIGDRWKKLSKEEKETYEKSAGLDKARYKKEMAEYRSGGQTTGGGPSGVESD